MNVTKPTIPREVAEAIEWLRGRGATTEDIVRSHMQWESGVPETEPLYEFARHHYDTVLRALVNGYEVEKAPEEQLREYVKLVQGRQLMVNTSARKGYYAGVCYGVVKALDILGIKIEGVND